MKLLIVESIIKEYKKYLENPSYKLPKHFEVENFNILIESITELCQEILDYKENYEDAIKYARKLEAENKNLIEQSSQSTDHSNQEQSSFKNADIEYQPLDIRKTTPRSVKEFLFYVRFLVGYTILPKLYKKVINTMTIMVIKPKSQNNKPLLLNTNMPDDDEIIH